MSQFIEETKLKIQEPLNPRNAFFAARRGNTAKVYDVQANQKIKYVDVSSLYPYICKRGKYPVGHPKVYVGEEGCLEFIGNINNIDKADGLIKCDILQPRNLYHPVLPVKMYGKLIFHYVGNVQKIKCNEKDRISQAGCKNALSRRPVQERPISPPD